MKVKYYCIVIIQVIFIMKIFSVFGQDVIYYEKNEYKGKVHNLNINPPNNSFQYHSDIFGSGSFIIKNPNAAIKIHIINLPWSSNNNRLPACQYPWMYIYADYESIDGHEQPFIAVQTNQYNDQDLKVECLTANLPQPDIFIPFDYYNININETDPHENDHNIPNLWGKGGHRVLVLKRAFFWENSENIYGSHGPYADIKIGICNPQILNYKWKDLYLNNSIWENEKMRPIARELPGPIWGGYAPPAPYPDPYDEWIDGPFGCIYSRIIVYDWSDAQKPLNEIVPIVHEGKFLRAYPGIITRDREDEILFKVGINGWLILENITLKGGPFNVVLDPSVDVGDVYWYGGWNGNYPEEVYNPQDNAAVTDEIMAGGQFRPYTDTQFWNFHNDSRFDGYKVGLLGNKFPKGVYNRPRTYMLIDKDKPAVFGQ